MAEYSSIPKLYSTDNVTLEQDAVTGNLKVKDAGIGYEQMATTVLKPWKLLETLSPSAVSSIGTGALAAYDEYLVVWKDIVPNTGGPDLNVRFNSDNTAANYERTYYNGTTGFSNATAGIQLERLATDFRAIGEAIISGKTGAVASGRLGVHILANNPDSAGMWGAWTGGNAVQITSMQFSTTSGTITGTIKVYGRSL